MSLTLGEASKQSGFAKSSLSQAVSKGRLAAVRRENGSFAIDENHLSVAALRAGLPGPTSTAALAGSSLGTSGIGSVRGGQCTACSRGTRGMRGNTAKRTVGNGH
jgi:hypothetical protein